MTFTNLEVERDKFRDILKRQILQDFSHPGGYNCKVYNHIFNSMISLLN